MIKNKTIELLAPARDVECALAAVNCGADAVYIGAPKFGARLAAGNSIGDIGKAVEYAHKFRVKVYAALNTILTDDELPEARRMIYGLYDAGVDALIVQDMGLLELDLPPLPLIASTQTDNASVEKVKFLEEAGFSRAILARELSVRRIREISDSTKIGLEFFVHGALCVCRSGRCYLSYASGGRSGNRGECAQPCRMNYSLKDSKGNILVKDKYLLSLKDLNLSDSLGELIDAGISSFKIEGRLKDAGYVKNVVSYYRGRLDSILEGSGMERPSSGKSVFTFKPDPYKTFNRGYTGYFLHGRNGGCGSVHTQKSTGEPLGTVKSVHKDFFVIEYFKGDGDPAGMELSNGDGICFFDRQGRLNGMNVVRSDGNGVYPHDIRWIVPGTVIYRNYNVKFAGILKYSPVERKIQVKMCFSETGKGFLLEMSDEDGVSASVETECEKIKAEKPELALDTIRKQLIKLGDTCFTCPEPEIRLSGAYFLPVGLLNGIRRSAVRKLESERTGRYRRKEVKIVKNSYPYPEKKLDFTGNVLNKAAEAFYRRHGAEVAEPAAESGLNMSGKRVMTAKYCIKYQLGLCGQAARPEDAFLKDLPENFTEPLFLSDGKHDYRLVFDCKNCVMEIFK